MGAAKICSLCGELKSEYRYIKATKHRKGYERHDCRDCERKRARENQRMNKDRERERRRILAARRKGIIIEPTPRQYAAITNWRYPSTADASKINPKYRPTYTIMKTHYEATGINLSTAEIGLRLHVPPSTIRHYQTRLEILGYIQSPTHNPIRGVVCPKCGHIIRRIGC